jgi:hypothetical protein
MIDMKFEFDENKTIKDNGKFGVYFSVIGHDLIRACKEPNLKQLSIFVNKADG